MTHPPDDHENDGTADRVAALLCDALTDTPYDAGPYIARAVAATRLRRRRTVALSAVAVLAVGSSLTALSLGRSGSHADQVATLVQTSPPPATAAYPTPHYLPPGVSAGGPFSAGPQGPPGSVRGKVQSFHLAGKANTNTMLSNTPSNDALLIANPTGYHPASVLAFYISPGTSGGIAPDAQTPFWTVQKITISGHPGWASVGKSNYGDEYVTWTDGKNSYELYCNHLHTTDGDSGVDMAQLIKMAQSVS